MPNKIKLTLAIVIALGVVFIAQATALNDIFFPLVHNEYLIATPTSTPKPGECLSGKAKGVCITELIYKPTTSPLDEYITLKNKGNSSVDLEMWRISSDSGNKFDITEEFTLSSGASVDIWTKIGTNNSTNIYMNRTTEFWLNTSDCAYVKDASDPRTTIDGYCYGSASFSPVP